MIIQIIKVLAPIITSLMVGIYCKKAKVIDDNANIKIKALLNEAILPAVLFNSFLFADYSKKSIVYILTIIISMFLSYVLASILKRFFIKGYREFFAEQVITWEGGTLGISLAALLLGQAGMQQMAVFDFGHALFLFGIIVPILSVKDSGKASPSKILKIVFSSKTFDGAIIGALLGIFGLSKIINASEAFSIVYHGIFDIVTSSATFLILLTIGYSIKIDRKKLVPLVCMSACRLLFMGIAFAFAVFFISRFIVIDKTLFTVLMIGYSLPPTFALQVFTSFRGDKNMQEFNSVFTSFTTIITLIIFVFISIYTL